ncbi:ABC transporter substrate-binding protein [Yimella sp. NH-Cas1]|uniref:ABC transporter substrate-binding protein n=1 Tax=Yimella sp. NH-Cas1 TaxID=2917726 RepID=UPI001EFA9F3D|nr:ABC transporter substrate-binding protein [Yimella sp. NH-Cas1]MCG8655922.1 ABC transporter substrate-binding protein [Yimella sp. NH-Cas1]
MALVHSRSRIALVTAVALTFGLTACGSDSLEEGTSSAKESVKSVAKDTSLADKVPADLKSKGTLTIGTDASYPPNEYFDTDGKTIVGMDIELLDAVLGKLGLKAKYVNGGFDSLILGVGSGKYDMSVSSFTINKERMQQVTMVSYLKAGSQWVVPKGNPKKISLDDACGKTVTVQKGTVQVADMQARSKKCTTGGKGEIKLLIEQDQSKATLNLSAGKADAMVADLPVSVDAVNKSGDKLELLGENYDTAPYGYVVKKDQNEFGNVLVEGLKAIKKDGTYDQILKKWKVDGGAIDDFAVNPSV